MPPKGLYPLPRHHMYGGAAQRLAFNSNDFREKNMPGPVKPSESAPEPSPKDKGTDKKSKRDKKEKKRKSGGGLDEAYSTPAKKSNTADLKAPETAVKAEKKHKRKSEDLKGSSEKSSKKKKKDKKHSHVEDVRSEPKKKRKRDSEVATVTPTAARSFLVGEDLAQKVAQAIGDHGAMSMLSSTPVPNEVETPKKKKRKSNGKIRKDQTNAEAVFASVREASTPIASKSPKVKKSTVTTGLEQHASKETPLNTPNKAKYITQTAQATPSALTATKIPKQSIVHQKTPVPLSQVGTHAPASQPIERKKDTALVPETPPSQRSRGSNVTFTTTPVPFNLNHRNAFTGPPLSTPSIPSSNPSGSVTPKPLPAAITKRKTPAPLPSVPNALTDANLTRHTEPLNDEPKPRPRAKGVSSTAESSGSTTSIKDMFARLNKRNPSSPNDHIDDDAGNPPSQPPAPKDVAASTFNTHFTALQATIDFALELTHLENYLAWDIANTSTPLPCLGAATGCTPKKEHLLHLSTPSTTPTLLTTAATRTRNAEELLMLATRANIPIPIGALAGTWTLYCPSYATTHHDRYAAGQRTLTISPIAGFNARNAYTARLKVPPRTMLYSILAFQTPPHASFGPVALQTSAEGYRMDAVFLGNGYMVLRVDLRELLQGRKGDAEGGGRRWMEFLGVREGAVEWWGDGDSGGGGGCGGEADGME